MANLKWYVLNTYAGHEDKVKGLIKQRIDIAGLTEYLGEIVVPTQNRIVINDGKRKNVEEKILPGYILIQLDLNDNTWALVRDTQGVVSFAGTGRLPTPLTEEEVTSILKFMEVEQPVYQTSFILNDVVKVAEGAFKDFTGKISEINDEKGKITVLLSIFGRETPVELDFSQVRKI